MIPPISRDLTSSQLREQWPSHGGDHAADVLAVDLHLHEVLGLVLTGRQISETPSREAAPYWLVKVEATGGDFVHGTSAKNGQRELALGDIRINWGIVSRPRGR